MHLLGVVLALLSGAASAEAQTSAEVDSIVARHVDALGGIDRLRGVHSVRMSGRVTGSGGRQAGVTREILRPDRVRTEFTYQGVTGVYAFDGERGWKVSPFDGSLAPEVMDDEETRQTAEQADIEGPLTDWKTKGHRVILVGKESLSDREVYKLEVTLRSGRVLTQYLDARSFLPVRSETTRLVRGRSIQVETTFDDYRAVGGVLFPHSIETGALGRPQRLKVAVEAIEVNPSLDDTRFEMPALER